MHSAAQSFVSCCSAERASGLISCQLSGLFMFSFFKQKGSWKHCAYICIFGHAQNPGICRSCMQMILLKMQLWPKTHRQLGISEGQHDSPLVVMLQARNHNPSMSYVNLQKNLQLTCQVASPGEKGTSFLVRIEGVAHHNAFRLLTYISENDSARVHSQLQFVIDLNGLLAVVIHACQNLIRIAGRVPLQSLKIMKRHY